MHQEVWKHSRLQKMRWNWLTAQEWSSMQVLETQAPPSQVLIINFSHFNFIKPIINLTMATFVNCSLIPKI
jgi:hypothetical protein